MSKFKEVASELEKLYTAKNSDYNNSFDKLMDEFGDLSLVLRLCDKVERLKALLKKEAQVKDEKFSDTLKDMVNYGIMWLMRQINSSNDGSNQQETNNMWHFPAVKFVKENSLTRQINHLESEINEVKDAYHRETNYLIMELWDVIHSAETALRILKFCGYDVFSVKSDVLKKNQERGYYNCHAGGN